MKLIEEKVNEIAMNHIKIIEDECIEACKKFNVPPEEIIIEYHANSEIKIKIIASHFKINNKFIYENGIIRNDKEKHHREG